jgi:hypothetical protein
MRSIKVTWRPSIGTIHESSVYIRLLTQFKVMKCGNQALEKLYECEEDTGEYILSIALERYRDVFNELDSSPWRRKDIDIDLRVFFEESSTDIPLKYGIILQFNVEKDKQDLEKEEHIKAGLKNYFSFVMNSMAAQIKSSYQKSGLYVLAALSMLFASITINSVIEANVAVGTLAEVISIGGWIFLWEAVSTYAFTSREPREKFHHYKRFSNSPIRFIYKER